MASTKAERNPKQIQNTKIRMTKTIPQQFSDYFRLCFEF